MQFGTRRINVTMNIEEREGLRVWAQHENKDPRELTRALIRQELVQRGFLPTNANSDGIRQDFTVAVRA